MLVTNPQAVMTTEAPFYPLPELPPQRPDGPASGAAFDDWYWKLQHFNAQIQAVRAEAERACAENQARVAAEIARQTEAIDRNTAAVREAAQGTPPAPTPAPTPGPTADLGEQALVAVAAWLSAVHQGATQEAQG